MNRHTELTTRVCRLENNISTNLSDRELCVTINEKFSPGLVIKNYNELCSLLDLDNKGGNTKVANIKNIQRFCEFEKDGQKFIIKKIFDSPKEKIDKRVSGNNSVYVTLIETILLDYFIRKNQRTLNFTKKVLWEELGMASPNYATNYDRKSFLYELQSIDNRTRQWHIDKAYSNSRKKLNDITKTALNSLKNRKLIEYRDDVIVASKGKNYFEVTEDWQIEKILQCERETLNELGCKNLKEVIFNSNKKVNMKRYTEIRNRKLRDTLGFDFIFRRYSIICNRKYLQQGLQENISELKKSLNSKIIDSLESQAQKDFDKNRTDLRVGNTHFIYPNYYVDIQKLIITKILNIDEKLVEEFITTLQIENELEEELDGLFSA